MGVTATGLTSQEVKIFLLLKRRGYIPKKVISLLAEPGRVWYGFKPNLRNSHSPSTHWCTYLAVSLSDWKVPWAQCPEIAPFEKKACVCGHELTGTQREGAALCHQACML